MSPRPTRIYALLLALLLGTAPLAAVRIKDLTVPEGARSNQLVGYGLVVGLAGDGDSTLSYTIQSIANTLQAFGVQVPVSGLKAKNVAAVMLTADLPPYTRSGYRIDTIVASMGDARSLRGGILLQTPLRGADGTVYAVAQGPLAVGGLVGGTGGAGGATVQKNHPTVGNIPGGAIVEREVPVTLLRDGTLNLSLLNPDYTTATRLSEAINTAFPNTAKATDAGAVNVRVPDPYVGQETTYIAQLGLLEVIPDAPARIVFNERTGTIVATQNVRISTVAISHGSLTITVTSTLSVSQPGAFADGGSTVVVPSTQTDVNEKRGGFKMVEDMPTLQELTNALNALGVSTFDMMSILQTLKTAGALQAELVIE